ncbi:MAG: putative ABC transporter ATP-binding protein [Candidatus Methanofastidiosum methylothiophilum]|nr:MAG: putative ABC transporter ATP-binding protein [Candidatus Methanofastidiosum methylthiophilus]HPO27040.1 ABC transporter ATP-binding protein [Petrotogaceae bacterium]
MPRNTTSKDEDTLKTSKSLLVKRLFAYMKPFKLKITAVIILMIVVMGINLVNPYLLKEAIDKHVTNKNYNGLLIIGIFFSALNVFSMFLSRARINIMSEVSNKIVLNIRQELYAHIQKLSFTFFDNRPVGKILARVVGDVNSLQQLFSDSVTNLIPEILTIVCTLFLMFSINFRLTLAAVATLPLLIGGLFFIETFSRKRWQNYRKKKSNLNAFIHEDFSGIKVVQSYNMEEKTSYSFKNYCGSMMNSFIRAVRLNDLFWPMVELCSGIGIVLVYWSSVKLVNTGSISIGTLVAFTAYISIFWRPIMNITNFYNSLITNFAAAERIFDILDTKPDIENKGSEIIMPLINGNVQFKNVSFGYDDGTTVLDNVSFNVKAGEKIALVGPTGAGKTTIINLISRFYDTKKGNVLIDGYDVKNVDLESLRSQMGIMLQDTFLFSMSITDNIRYGKLDASDEEVINAAKAVNAHDFIMKLEKGYETNVNERGSRLSVGQRQLISFARALLADPRILILDEATSNIDTQTERLVQSGIKKLLHGRTSFVIAHRLSTIRDADRIFYVDDGKIIESGTHAELLAKKKAYYELYMSQYKFISQGA